MVALVSVETLLLVVLLLLVAGLLRSHATILRRLELRDGATEGVPAPPARERAGDELHAPDLAGSTPHGDAVKLAFDGEASRPTLLAFLTSGCTTCAGFWETLGEPRLPPGVQTVIVTHGSDRERLARLRSLAPPGIPVVLSSQAWEEYRVPGAPYFVLVDGFVRGEGVATSWQALASLVSDAIEDQQEADQSGGAWRARQVEEKLAAAGIGPDDPSLYPGEQLISRREDRP
jgi:hypothetical protein